MGTKSFNNYADLITFSRASGATYLDSDGLLKTATTNTPRIEYDANGNRLGLLIEEQRTNLVTYSEAFSNASWVKSNASITANDASAPDGTTTADKHQSTASARSFVIFEGSMTSADTVAGTVRVKAGSQSQICLTVGVTNQTVRQWFNLSLETIGTAVESSASKNNASIKNLGGGWFECSLTITANAANTTPQMVIDVVTADNVLSANLGDNVYIWGAQLEAGAFPTSYIPTSGSTATRAADVASIPVSDFGYNQREGTVVAIGQISDAGGIIRRWVSINDGTINNSIQAALTSVETSSYLEVRYGGSVQATAVNGSFASGSEVKTAIAYSLNDFAISANGASVATDSAGLVPVVDEVRIGSHAGGTNPINGHIKSLKYYPRRLSNAQLQELTQ